MSPRPPLVHSAHDDLPVPSHWVLITGTSSGLGAALTTALAGRGDHVIATGRSPEDGARWHAAAPGRVVPLVLDVRDAAAITDAAASVKEVIGDGDLRAVVNNAGVVAVGPLVALADAVLADQLDVNVLGPLRVTRALLPLLAASQGRVINVGSISGRVTLPFLGPYSASKAALAAVTSALRLELGPLGVSVSLLEVGNVRTPLWDKALAGDIALGPTIAAALDPAMVQARRLAKRMVAGASDSATFVRIACRALDDPTPRAIYTVGCDAWTRRTFGALVPGSLMERAIRWAYDLPATQVSATRNH